MKKNLMMALATGSGLLAAQLAHANAELQVYVGSTKVYDSGAVANNLSANAGFLNGAPISAGGWTLTDATGTWDTTGTTFGSSGIDLGTLDIGNTGASSDLTIIFSAAGFPPPGGGLTAVTSDHDTSGNLSGTFSTYWDAGNALLAQTTALTSQAVPSSYSAAAAVNASAPYSLTEVLHITSGAGSISTDDSLTVPDGGITLATLGSAFVLLAGVRNRFGKKA